MTFQITAEEKRFLLRERARKRSLSTYRGKPTIREIAEEMARPSIARIKKLCSRLKVGISKVKVMPQPKNVRPPTIIIWSTEEFPSNFRYKAIIALYGKEFLDMINKTDPEFRGINSSTIGLNLKEWDTILRLFKI